MSESVTREVVQKIAERVAAEMRGIVEARVYPDEEAAELLGMRGQHRGRDIRALPIPKVPISATGRKIGYLGSDLLEWIRKRRTAA